MGSMLLGSQFAGMDEAARVVELNRLIAAYREPDFALVPPARVVPDTTNREYTGISVMHLHYIASSMQEQGFTPRDNATGAGHDLPVVVRETTGAASQLGVESLSKWRSSQEGNAEYPPPQPWGDGRAGEEYYCSLGNGHFFQALNLFGAGRPRKFSAAGGAARYEACADAALQHAVGRGVPCIVLRSEMPLPERKFVSMMHNSTFEFRWVEGADGEVHVEHGDGAEFRHFSGFDGLVKHADSWELDEIIRVRMKREAEGTAANCESRRAWDLSAASSGGVGA